MTIQDDMVRDIMPILEECNQKRRRFEQERRRSVRNDIKRSIRKTRRDRLFAWGLGLVQVHAPSLFKWYEDRRVQSEWSRREEDRIRFRIEYEAERRSRELRYGYDLYSDVEQSLPGNPLLKAEGRKDMYAVFETEVP